jgi:hypothetical protein
MYLRNRNCKLVCKLTEQSSALPTPDQTVSQLIGEHRSPIVLTSCFVLSIPRLCKVSHVLFVSTVDDVRWVAARLVVACVSGLNRPTAMLKKEDYSMSTQQLALDLDVSIAICVARGLPEPAFIWL